MPRRRGRTWSWRKPGSGRWRRMTIGRRRPGRPRERTSSSMTPLIASSVKSTAKGKVFTQTAQRERRKCHISTNTIARVFNKKIAASQQIHCGNSAKVRYS